MAPCVTRAKSGVGVAVRGGAGAWGGGGKESRCGVDRMVPRVMEKHLPGICHSKGIKGVVVVVARRSHCTKVECVEVGEWQGRIEY